MTIHFPGYETVINNVYDSGNEHVFAYWDTLNPDQKKHLLEELSTIHFETLQQLYELTKRNLPSLDFKPAPYTPLPKTDEEKKEFEKAKQIGIGTIKKGKVAAFVVAG